MQHQNTLKSETFLIKKAEFNIELLPDEGEPRAIGLGFLKIKTINGNLWIFIKKF